MQIHLSDLRLQLNLLPYDIGTEREENPGVGTQSCAIHSSYRLVRVSASFEQVDEFKESMMVERNMREDIVTTVAWFF